VRPGEAKASRNTALAAALCPEEDARCIEQASIIAECRHVLQRVHATRAAALEESGARGDRAVGLLAQFERYERRAWSRSRRAAELLEALRDMRSFRFGEAP
jgi:hypothetical protein